MSFSWSKVFLLSAIFFFIMFYTVMFYANPVIDGKDGFGVIKLQLSFFKDIGVEIVNNWGVDGANRFKNYIFTDYIYAINYVLFFVSLIKVLIEKSKMYSYNFLIYIAILAGFFDWIENSIEIFFLSNMQDFSNTLFFLHSIISLIKWITLPIIFIGIVKLYKTVKW